MYSILLYLLHSTLHTCCRSLRALHTGSRTSSRHPLRIPRSTMAASQSAPDAKGAIYGQLLDPARAPQPRTQPWTCLDPAVRDLGNEVATGRVCQGGFAGRLAGWLDSAALRAVTDRAPSRLRTLTTIQHRPQPAGSRTYLPKHLRYCTS
ncbi:hypothetical protein BZA05DRAFT_381471 [Tricharina praecox]|uniref:uncharacterized protein n=1 Tax=Tricharina praecox TaxID=43433 RepID=UPI00221E691D|nr:uncharacterized protein BZA05DRAFT_381471 [Tricharina praecox]KAI5858510.1 hypothetical protein BZA05DRAFT_381471 [Tricharina praecox]